MAAPPFLCAVFFWVILTQLQTPSLSHPGFIIICARGLSLWTPEAYHYGQLWAPEVSHYYLRQRKASAELGKKIK